MQSPLLRICPPISTVLSRIPVHNHSPFPTPPAPSAVGVFTLGKLDTRVLLYPVGDVATSAKQPNP